MGMKFASKSNVTLVAKSHLFELVKGVLSVTSPTNIQKDHPYTMMVHNVTDFPFTYTCTNLHAAIVPPPTAAQLVRLSNVGGCVGPVWSAPVWGAHAVPAAYYMVVKEKVSLELFRRFCCANLSSLPMSVLTKPAPQGLLLSFDDHSSSDIVIFSFHAGDNMILAG
eukprot:1161803-Pelagomonas_calceolata.AAC.14